MNNINKLRLATLLVVGMLFASCTASYAFPFFGNGFNGYNGGGCGWRHHHRYHRHGW